MALPPELIRRLDLRTALEAELTAANRLLPRRWDRRALEGHAAEIARNIGNQLNKKLPYQRANIMFVDKNRRGARPISEMSLVDRTIYRAIVEVIRGSLPPELASRGTHQEFREAPLSIEYADFITTTDVTSFYEFVDHEFLAQELVAQSGEALAVDGLMDLLYVVMGKKVGIPQIHVASDVLGDTYIDVVRRRLRRAGYATFSYSDDFRIATRSLAEARAALELCAREARELGLALNESKTFTFGRDKYEESLSAFSVAERRLFTDDELEELVVVRRGSVYEPEVVDDFEDDEVSEVEEDEEGDSVGFGGDRAAPEDEDAVVPDADHDEVDVPSTAQLQAAERALETWTEQVDAEEHNTQLIATAESLLAVALPVLGAAGSIVAPERLSEVLRMAPSLTPAVAKYAIRSSRRGRGAQSRIRSLLDELVLEESHSDWQRMWLAEIAGSVRPTVEPHGHYLWLEACLDSSSSSLAAVAASALGRLGRADTLALNRLLDRVHPAWRMLVVWALARQDSVSALASADNKTERLLANAVASADE